jgi:hypothetical protein
VPREEPLHLVGLLLAFLLLAYGPGADGDASPRCLRKQGRVRERYNRAKRDPHHGHLAKSQRSAHLVIEPGVADVVVERWSGRRCGAARTVRIDEVHRQPIREEFGVVAKKACSEARAALEVENRLALADHLIRGTAPGGELDGVAERGHD